MCSLGGEGTHQADGIAGVAKVTSSDGGYSGAQGVASGDNAVAGELLHCCSDYW